MISERLITPGQLTHPRVIFVSLHGLTLVTVHMRFRCPRTASRGGLYGAVNSPCRGNFSSCEQIAKIAPGQRIVLRMLIINVYYEFPIEIFLMHQKQAN